MDKITPYLKFKNKMDIKAKKHFGQNFLVDESIKDKIIQSIPNDNSIKIVEIGPGLGDLTKRLLLNFSVVAYEVDKDLIKHLKCVFKDEIKNGKFLLNIGDVLEFWNDKKSLYSSSYMLVANIPYNISTPILTNALGDDNCKSMIVMVQKEFAQKLNAKSKTPDFSPISILANIVGDVNILFDVAPTSFEPQPKVVSSVLRVDKKSDLKIDFLKLQKYLKKAFAAPRKRLQKNLTCGYEKELVFDAFKEIDIDPNIRPHELSTQSHFRLFNKLN